MTDWTPEVTHGKQSSAKREWAEVVFVPNDHAVLTDIFEPFRYIVVRERLGDQLRLLDVEANPKARADKLNGLPFPMMVLNKCGVQDRGKSLPTDAVKSLWQQS